MEEREEEGETILSDSVVPFLLLPFSPIIKPPTNVVQKEQEAQ